MLTKVQAGPYTVRGVSVGGIYTSLHVRELDVVLDVGLAPRSFAGARAVFLSHGHADHAGALFTLLGTRMLTCNNRKLKLYLPAPIADDVRAIIDIVDRMQRTPARVELVPLEPGDERVVHGDVRVRAFRSFHPVPSLGYQFFRRVNKLRAAYRHYGGEAIRELKESGEDMFDVLEHLELAYATDTLPSVLEHQPSLFDSKVLILECTFLDGRKSPELAHQSCHIHLEDLLPYADRFRNEALVLMHFSQIYKPKEIVPLLDQRCPPALRARIVPFASTATRWPG
jgi:ribonuclease Z